MAPSKLRKVMGTVKDQTSIGIAKVVSTRAPDLDVAIVKATSHEEFPTDEKYVREILLLTSYSRGYVNACVAGLSKRLAKTHNWVVAVKAVWLIHRLLRDGDPSFEHEVLYATRRGARLLNLSDFRDDSHSNAWDYSAFVRTYAFYLDECLDCALSDKNNSVAGRARWIQQDIMVMNIVMEIMEVMDTIATGMVTMITKHGGKMKLSLKMVNKWQFEI